MKVRVPIGIESTIVLEHVYVGGIEVSVCLDDQTVNFNISKDVAFDLADAFLTMARKQERLGG